MATLRLVPKVHGSTTVIDALIGAKVEHSIFYQFDGDFRPDHHGAGNAALAGFLPYAMRHGLDIHVDGAADFDLLVKLEEAQDAWTLWHPGIFKRVKLDAAEISSPMLPQSSTAAIAFSGGLDATYALHAHQRKLIGRRSLDVRFAALVQGFDLPLDKDDWFTEARRRAAIVADNYEVPLVTVRTNWKMLRAPWEQSFIFAVASVMHQFKGSVGYGIIAADEAYDGEVLGWGSNSITNQMVSGASFPLHFTGAGRRRTEKALVVRDEEVVLANLRVCWERPDSLGNCGNCEKCIRTKLNFLAAGTKEVPALGGPVTPAQVRSVSIGREAVMSLFRELSECDWRNHPEIQTALNDLVSRGVQKPSRFRRRISKYRRSLQKRGLWPAS